jgi:type VI secretion system protein ImpF
MAELTPQERLQPALLDRLTDEEPDKVMESRDRRVLSLRKLREVVLRDLAWLFNAGNHLTAADFADYPEAAGSVINYGMPDFAGLSSSNINTRELERLVRQAIWDFEPRIIRDSVRVRTLRRDEMSLNALTFEIEGELWAQPVPFHLFLKTQVDLETGSVSVVEQGGSGAA